MPSTRRRAVESRVFAEPVQDEIRDGCARYERTLTSRLGASGTQRGAQGAASEKERAMANIRRRDPREVAHGGRTSDPYGYRVDPLAMMQRLMGWDPYREMESFFPGGGAKNYVPE